MELEGAKRCFDFLMRVKGLKIKVFISDRHKSINKWVRTSQKGTEHYYDIWHITRSVTKKMNKASKEKGCERIAEWIKGIRNHIYWCATTTSRGFQQMILAKWKSFSRHVRNQHHDHPDALFKNCAHGDPVKRRHWIKIGSRAYEKLNLIINDTRLQNDIKRLSNNDQTSCLEGYHSTLNHWHPKMLHFSWMGTYCR